MASTSDPRTAPMTGSSSGTMSDSTRAGESGQTTASAWALQQGPALAGASAMIEASGSDVTLGDL